MFSCLLEFSLNCTQLATLAMKAYVRKNKINLVKWCYNQWGLNLGRLVIHSDAYLTQLTWQVLIEGYLTSVLSVTFGLGCKCFGLTSNAKLEVAVLDSKTLDTPRVQILSISCSFSENLAKSYVSTLFPMEGWFPYLGEILDPPLVSPVRQASEWNNF